MTVDLIDAVHEDYPDNDIRLFGVSWGPVLAAEAAVERLDLIDEVVVYGQISKSLFFNEEIFTLIGNMKLNDTEKKYFAEIKAKESYTVDDLEFVLAKVISGGHYFSKGLFRPYLAELLMGMVTSSDYTFDDVMAIGSNGYQYNVTLMMELIDIDLTSTFESIQVPYRIYQGDLDVITSTKRLTEIVEFE